MSKFTKFIFFNIFVYVSYLLIDKIFIFFDFYSNAQLGVELSVIPTNSDIYLIVFNSFISSILAFYLLKKMQEES